MASQTATERQQTILGVEYTFELVDGWVFDDQGRKCHGLTYTDRSRVRLSGDAMPGKRRQTLYHELGHIFLHELGITDTRALDEEGICNLIATGIGSLDAGDLKRLEEFVTGG